MIFSIVFGIISYKVPLPRRESHVALGFIPNKVGDEPPHYKLARGVREN